ncbi:MAG: Phosphopantetheine adenylyltransferase [Clostridia bacterium 41_269]|nr:MAG: Phosphopantetheine adenylyltransferase [Clostridia bacterium 41_269]
MPTAIYPGTFDPVTNGHLDIIQRATSIFDTVVVAVAEDSGKDTLFSLEERLEILREVTSSLKGVYVESFSGLLIKYVKKKGADAIVRGLRAVSDFEYEMQMAMMNKKMAEDIETVFFFTSTEYSFLSSSVVKQVASLGGCVKGLVPSYVEKKLKEKYNFLK